MRGYHYVAVSASVIFLLAVAAKAVLQTRAGIRTVRFGDRDKKDFILLPCMAFFYYLVFACAFKLPAAGGALFYRYFAHWYGAILCCAGVVFAASAVIALGASFRIGLDDDRRISLVTKGPFAINRNPIYTGFLFLFAGVFITFANWVFIIYIIGGFLLIHRQILKEEKLLKEMFGDEYAAYRKLVRRYF